MTNINESKLLNSEQNELLKNHKKYFTIALAGNPNAGKTCIFNALTKSKQRVGNYPGVTVEKKEGFFSHQSRDFQVIDLPGTYSLTSYSPEEKIARQILVEEKPDLVVHIIDTTNLERNLYLTVQLMELGANLILALNMSDEAQEQGLKLDLELFSKRLGCPVIETVGNKGLGIDKLKEVILNAVDHPREAVNIRFGKDLEPVIEELAKKISLLDGWNFPARYAATKLLEGDQEIIDLFAAKSEYEEVLSQAQKASSKLTIEHDTSPQILIADQRYGFAAGLVREASISIKRLDRLGITEKIDALFLNRVIGIPLFFILMYVLFWLVFSIGEYPMNWIEGLLNWLANNISRYWSEQYFSGIRSLLLDGVIGGVGGVIVFLPNILLLFLGIALLEETGYMARVAFIMDGIMHKLGLHGKSFIPMLIGFGCTIPGIMATRTLESERDRLTTIMVLPLMSCGARLTIYLLIIPAFFPKYMQAFMLWSIYLIGILLAIILIRILRWSVLSGENSPFVMELPPYRWPTLRSLFWHTWFRAYLYLRKAGTIILGISIIMWLVTSYPKKPVLQIEHETSINQISTNKELEKNNAREVQNLSYSIAGRIGRSIEPVLSTMGFDWRIGTALIGAFAAKEVFVAQMGIIFSLGNEESATSTSKRNESLRKILKTEYSPLIGFCIMLFTLIATPCMATVAITRRETGSWRWTVLQFGGLTLIAYLLTTLVYQIGSLIL